MNKADMRRLLRARFEGADARAIQSRRICDHIKACAWYQQAGVIGAYIPMGHEADVSPVLQDALAAGKKLALPRCGQAPEMSFCLVEHLEELCLGAYGLLEPDDDADIVSAEEIDLLLVPLEGIDRKGFRLGKGGGYYDRFLKEWSGMSMGCALSWQWVDAVPREPWDVQLRSCADAEGIQCFL